MIVQKFGGTSVADADRMNRAAAIVAAERGRSPVVVVSALGGVTDLLTLAVDEAVAGRKEALEPVLAELERRHRWALAGACAEPRRRHDLELEVALVRVPSLIWARRKIAGGEVILDHRLLRRAGKDSSIFVSCLRDGHRYACEVAVALPAVMDTDIRRIDT